MGDIVGKAVKATAKGLDKERKKLFRGVNWLALLARGRNTPFSELRYYESGFIPRSNTFRTGFYVEIATLDDLQLDILKLSFFAIDGQCYSVSDGDVFYPGGDRFTWMIYGTFIQDKYVRTP